MTRTFGMLAAAGLAAMTIGCAMAPSPEPRPFDRRVTVAADLAADVVVTDIRCVRGAGGHLEFQANVVNNQADDCGIEWRIVWLNADGIEIESAVSNWTKLMVSPKDIAEIRGTAASAAATDFRFHVRRLRR